MVYRERSSASATCSADLLTRKAPRSSRRLTTSIFSSRDIAAGVLPIFLEDLGDHAGDDVADVVGEDLLRLGAASPPCRPRAARLARVRCVWARPETSKLRPRMPKTSPSASRRRHGERLEDLAVARRDVEAHVGPAFGGAPQRAQHEVGGDVTDTAAGHVAVLDRDDGARKLTDVVQDHFAIRAEHLGQAVNERQQRAHAGVERVLDHDEPPDGDRDSPGAAQPWEHSCIASPRACQKECGLTRFSGGATALTPLGTLRVADRT